MAQPAAAAAADTPWSLEDLPTKVVFSFCQSSAITTMEFHPTRYTLLLGVAFTNGIIHLYHYEAGNFLQHREHEAHAGAVNDIAFTTPPQKYLSIVTCGDDKLIKVWDLEG
ncbi:Topless-related protein 3 [Cardamine amara subsp. amara]|uniref:Topless-related protein 3 n=1 Tax=Cardamine amara subsp. amara TaxID=228776 RepID=A0ABD1B7U6_CARAN